MNERRTIDLGPLPELIGYVLRRAQLAVFQDFFAAFAPFDIRPAQFSVLTIIERNPGLTQTQVAEALGIKRTNFVGMLDELEKRGLAERRQARDKRSYALYLHRGRRRADAQAQARDQGARKPHDRARRRGRARPAGRAVAGDRGRARAQAQERESFASTSAGIG